MDSNYFSNLSFPCPREAPNKIWATLAQRLQRSRLKFSTFFPYKCIGKQTWPYHKKVKMSMFDHSFRNFGRPPVPNDLCKDSATRHPRFWRRRFLKVFTIYGHGGHLGQWTVTVLAILHSPAPGRLQMKFEHIVPETPEEKSFEIVNIFSYTNPWGSKLDLAVKSSNVNVRPLFQLFW